MGAGPAPPGLAHPIPESESRGAQGCSGHGDHPVPPQHPTCPQHPHLVHITLTLSPSPSPGTKYQRGAAQHPVAVTLPSSLCGHRAALTSAQAPGQAVTRSVTGAGAILIITHCGFSAKRVPSAAAPLWVGKLRHVKGLTHWGCLMLNHPLIPQQDGDPVPGCPPAPLSW